MTVEAIRAHLERFHSVNLITSSENSYLVPHPDFLTFSPTGRTCLVYAADGEYYTSLDVLTITEIAPAKPKRPSPRKKKR